MPANRRPVLRYLLVSVVVTASTILAFTPTVTPSSAAPAATQASAVPVTSRATQRPNLVLITTDDQTLSDMAWMPSTRELIGRAGITFTEGVNPHPLCCPARAEILTGQYAQNNGVRTNRGKYGGFKRLDTRNVLPVWLRNSGYHTGFVGKYLNGYEAKHGMQPGWDLWNPTVRGVYAYYGFTQYDSGRMTRYPAKGGRYITDVVAADTRRMIRRWAPGRKPFFIWSSYVAPHDAVCKSDVDWECPRGHAVPRRSDRGRYADVVPPMFAKPSFRERDVSDKVPFVRRFKMRGKPAMAKKFRLRIESLAAVDRAVKGTVTALRNAGELGNTVILFTSDNGYLLGEHRHVGKIMAYEEAVRVPFLMRGPGIPAGERRSQVMATIDIAPTFARLARATPSKRVDGRSVLRYVDRPGAADHRTMLLQAGPQDARSTKVGWLYRGARTDRYTYASWARYDFTELYDRERDPFQLENVAEDPAYAEVLAEMRHRTKVLKRCSGASCATDFGAVPEPAT